MTDDGSLHPGWFTLEPPVTVRPTGYDRDLQLRVALPLSYHESDASYPVLWVTDNDLETALTAVGPRDIILVGVGSPRTGPGYHMNRAWDFYPDAEIHPLPPYGDFVRARVGDGPHHPGGGAHTFLDFLIDEARPLLTAKYRMDADDHALEGYSGGGWFVTFAMFKRPGDFAKYIAGAPALYFSQDLIWRMEQQYADTHSDLDVAFYLGTGDGEMTDPDAIFGCFSSMARMAEILTCRRYPSLRMTVQVFPGETHMSARPFVMANAVKALWGADLVIGGSRSGPRRG